MKFCILITVKSESTTFPVDEIIPDLLRAFEASNCVILSAPPGAGKTTRVPVALMKGRILNNAKILMLEPRRLAARRSAEFMAGQFGEQPGTTIGYRIRGETRTSEQTRIEILTEGVLTRMLQSDPDLPGVGMIIFDEFHERSIHADLGLAFSLDVQKNLRNDLRILIMSATLEGARITSILGDVPLVESKGRLFPVETHYSRFSSGQPLETRIADAVERALEREAGDVLVFLPGWREIQRANETLAERRLSDDVVVHTLHGEASFASQSAALAPAPAGKRKVILSTNVAETSLTIEGVRIVIDSGLARVSRFDPRKGMSGLVTVPVSKSSADQRRGRAGRQAPGSCYRLWTEDEHLQRTDFSQPEIKSADLMPLALELARWGAPNGQNLLFLDPPPPANLRQARSILFDLEAVHSDGKLTDLGRSMSELPVHPRLAHMILRGKSLGLGAIACDLAALLEERDLFAGQKDADADLTTRWSALETNRRGLYDRVVEQAGRLKTMAGVRDKHQGAEHIGLLLAFAYPDRIAKQRGKLSSSYLLASGVTASLPPGSTLSRYEFLAVADADTIGGGVRIYLCAPLTKQELLESFADSLQTEDIVRWNSAEECVEAGRVSKIGALVLAESPLPSDDERIPDAMIEGVRTLGLQALPWDKESRGLHERSEWLRLSHLVNEDWPDVSDGYLTESLNVWLKPFLMGIRQRAHLSRIDLSSALKSLFTHGQLKILNERAPETVKLPSGSVSRINYSTGAAPVLAVRIQEMFGQTDTPRIGGGNVPLVIHLLSPAKRPLAVTQDLHSFWKKTYPQILGQMRATYPKHIWPDDPLHAHPTSKTKRQLGKHG